MLYNLGEMVHSATLILAAVVLQTADGDRSANAKEPVVPDGIWPTQRMIEHAMIRWADETGAKYELNDEQVENLQGQLLERWPKFFQENRASLQPLFNEFIETRIAPKPPDPETVRDWAERAMPVFEKLETQLLETQQGMAGYMTAKQRAKLALEKLKTTAGLGLFREKLKLWREGQFEEHEWWDPPPRVMRARRANREREQRAAEKRGEFEPGEMASGPAMAKERIEEELLRWDYFVEEFIESYALREDQREAAYSILRECKERARAHRDRNRERMEALERELAEAGHSSEEQRAEIAKLYGPIDALFAELKQRIEVIPTSVQSAAVKKGPQDKSRE